MSHRSHAHGAHRAGKAPSQRQLRVGEELRHVLAEILQRGDFHDPALQAMNVTVTEVRISPDLRNATVFVTPLGGGDMGEALAALRRAAPYLRGQIAHAVRLRLVPTLGFEADTSFDYAGRIETILHSPEVARDLGTHDEADDPEDEDWDDEDDAEDAGGDDFADEERADPDAPGEDDEDDDEDGDGDGRVNGRPPGGRGGKGL